MSIGPKRLRADSNRLNLSGLWSLEVGGSTVG
jgi:hypothetical protein